MGRGTGLSRSDDSALLVRYFDRVAIRVRQDAPTATAGPSLAGDGGAAGCRIGWLGGDVENLGGNLCIFCTSWPGVGRGRKSQDCGGGQNGQGDSG